MANVTTRDVEYHYDSARLLGYFCGEQTSRPLPGVVLIHDAFGVGEYIRRRAEQVAQLGYAVLAADVWGEGKQLTQESEIGPMIGRFARDRKTWMGRLVEARQALVAQPGVDPSRIAFVGYCFGGASVLEYLRTVGGIQGGVSLHGGLGLVGDDWSAAPAGGSVLILTGADDPMADTGKLLELQKSLTSAGIDWQLDIYGNTKHGFTRPDSDRANRPHVVAYSKQSDRRSWDAMARFLQEIFSV